MEFLTDLATTILDFLYQFRTAVTAVIVVCVLAGGFMYSTSEAAPWNESQCDRLLTGYTELLGLPAGTTQGGFSVEIRADRQIKLIADECGDKAGRQAQKQLNEYRSDAGG